MSLPRDIRILEIGPGTGLLALVFALLLPKVCYVLIDLPEVRVFSEIFLCTVMPGGDFTFYDEFPNVAEKRSLPRRGFVFLPSNEVDNLPNNCVDLVINTNSFQEMRPEVISEYFRQARRLLRGPRLFYQSNRERKVMDEVPIMVKNYPYDSSDDHILDRENDFMRHHWTTARIGNVPVGLIRRRRRHRQMLTKLAPLVKV